MSFMTIQSSLNVKWEQRTLLENESYLSGEGRVRGGLLGQLFR